MPMPMKKGYNKEIMDRIAERLEIGKREYGHQVDINDGRNWVKEALEEALDLSVYISAKLLQLEEKGK